MSTVTYFAYGSNMLKERLQQRCGSAVFAGVAMIRGYRLEFSKKSNDGSGKATIVGTDDNVELYGSLFAIDNAEIHELDNAEYGYARVVDFRVMRINDNSDITTTTYIAKQNTLEKYLRPYDWYIQLVIAGARQSGFPENYISQLDLIESIPDPIPERPQRLEAIKLLTDIGRRTQ